MTDFLLLGLALGVSAGLAPGPLLTLVVSETLRHDVRAGIKVALAPVVTDLPIILTTCFVLAKLSNFHGILGVVSAAGGFLLLYLGIGSIRCQGADIVLEGQKPKSLGKGILTNLLSPHPYLFWFGVGAPTVMKAARQNALFPLLFIFGFYLCLVGCKILLALAVGRSKSFLRGSVYIYSMRSFGVVLCLLALALFNDALKLWGIPLLLH